MTTDESQHGITLRALRCSATPPLRQAVLAEKLGVKPSTISMIERGARGISVPMLRRIADVLLDDESPLMDSLKGEDIEFILS